MEILENLKDGHATCDDVKQLERIATNIQLASFCGLGQAAAVPILTGLRFFRDEFMAHVAGQCPVGVCPMHGKPNELTIRPPQNEMPMAA
jgi:hypothetical protein